MIRGLAFLLLWFPMLACAHSLSDSYLSVGFEGQRFEGDWQVALRDIELAVGVDIDGNGDISWSEVQRKKAEINRWLQANLSIQSGASPCTIEFDNYMVNELGSGVFLYVPISGSCAAVEQVSLKYTLLFDIDATHRGIATINMAGESQTVLFSPANPVVTMERGGQSLVANAYRFLIEGVWHIWIGFDHILFLMALLIPIVLADKARTHSTGTVRGWTWKTPLPEILKVVTAFTVAHSITLILATLGVVSLPSRFVEIAIALTVVISGLNVIFGFFRGRHWQIAFLFGLIHGFGFAGVLTELSLPRDQLVASLLAFNVGVEIGQFTIVLLLVPILALARPPEVRRFALVSSGLFVAVAGSLWVIERLFGFTILSLNTSIV